MTLVLRASVTIRATPQQVWDNLVDWPGQSRWIPFTTVHELTPGPSGSGTSIHAFSGFQIRGLRIGLPDTFVVTNWSPPEVLEVLHLGPAFRGEGEFRLIAGPDPQQPRTERTCTELTCTEAFTLPGGAPVESVARIVLPIMRSGLTRSLRTLRDRIETQDQKESG